MDRFYDNCASVPIYFILRNTSEIEIFTKRGYILRDLRTHEHYNISTLLGAYIVVNMVPTPGRLFFSRTFPELSRTLPEFFPNTAFELKNVMGLLLSYTKMVLRSSIT